jgi:RNA polymerase sigma-70 factor, ECF subfamily
VTEGEQEALFQCWLRDHLGLVIKVVRSYALSPADQEDLMQEIFVQLWKSIPNFRGESKETTWIYRVSIQTAMIWRRGEQRRQKHYQLWLNQAVANLLSVTEGSGADRQLIDQLYAAIYELPKVDASIAIMHLDGLTYQEISEVLGISENYVGVKLNRIRKELSERIGEKDR